MEEKDELDPNVKRYNLFDSVANALLLKHKHIKHKTLPMNVNGKPLMNAIYICNVYMYFRRKSGEPFAISLFLYGVEPAAGGFFRTCQKSNIVIISRVSSQCAWIK